MFSIVKTNRDEYREGNLAVRVWKVTFLGITVFRARLTSTNNQAVRQLTVVENKQVKGFNN